MIDVVATVTVMIAVGMRTCKVEGNEIVNKQLTILREINLSERYLTCSIFIIHVIEFVS